MSISLRPVQHTGNLTLWFGGVRWHSGLSLTWPLPSLPAEDRHTADFLGGHTLSVYVPPTPPPSHLIAVSAQPIAYGFLSGIHSPLLNACFPSTTSEHRCERAVKV